MTKEMRKFRQSQKKIRAANRTQRKLDQTAHIRARKAAKLPNIGARRNRKNLRNAEGRGVKMANRALDTVDKTVHEVGETVRDPNTGKNISSAAAVMI